jgi:hypothetical protein
MDVRNVGCNYSFNFFLLLAVDEYNARCNMFMCLAPRLLTSTGTELSYCKDRIIALCSAYLCKLRHFKGL